MVLFIFDIRIITCTGNTLKIRVNNPRRVKRLIPLSPVRLYLEGYRLPGGFQSAVEPQDDV